MFWSLKMAGEKPFTNGNILLAWAVSVGGARYCEVKVHKSQRLKWPELIPVLLAWSMPRSIAIPPLDGMLIDCRVSPQQYVTSTHLYTWVMRDKVE